MKNLVILFFMLSVTASVSSQEKLNYYTYVEAKNVGAVKSILLENLGGDFVAKGGKMIWQNKALNYTYRVSYRDGKLRIYYKGIHDTIKEKLKFMYEEIKALS